MSDASSQTKDDSRAFHTYRDEPTLDRRNEIVARYLALADSVARRFARRGEPLDDLAQVAYFGLIKSVERFDPSVGSSFVSFAIPTMVGEIKRHFRDRTWSLHVGRPTKDLLPRLRDATDKLTSEQGRSPSAAEVAHALGTSVDAVLLALEAQVTYRASSLDALAGRSVFVGVGALDPELTAVVDRLSVQRLLERLPERERRIVELRYFGEMTQSEIAEQTGISQMHVSRLLRRSLAQLHELAADGMLSRFAE